MTNKRLILAIKMVARPVLPRLSAIREEGTAP